MRILKTYLAFLILSAPATHASVLTENFTRVELHSIGKVFISQGDSQSVEVRTGGSQKEIETEIKNGKLDINSSIDADYYITMKAIEGLSVSGSGEITGQNTLHSESLQLEVSGSGKMMLDLEVRNLNIDISGVGKLTLTGTADEARIGISGSGKVEGFGLRIKNCTAGISGVGKCNLDVTESLTTDISGMGTVNYKTRPASLKSDVSGVGKVRDTDGGSEDESSGGGKNDTTKISMGETKILIVRNDSIVEMRKEKNRQSTPIWAGVELGFNSFVNADNKSDLPAGYDFLDLNTGKSVSVALNLLYKNFRFGKSNFWFTTGLGITWNNYRFEKNIALNAAGDTLSGSPDTTSTRNYSKSKLTTTYLTAPLMFEIFTSKKIKNAFHFGAGALLGYKIGSHTKMKYTEDGVTVKPKEYDDFHLSPFRYGVRVALGYRKFNVFADYYLSPLFRDDKGPELYPINVGITLAAF